MSIHSMKVKQLKKEQALYTVFEMATWLMDEYDMGTRFTAGEAERALRKALKKFETLDK